MDDGRPRVTAPLDVLVVTGGHPFEAEPFFAVFDALDGINWTGATAPEAPKAIVNDVAARIVRMKVSLNSRTYCGGCTNCGNL